MIAIFSDAHANPYALEAALKDMRSRNPEKIIFLGDVLTGPDPRWTIAILKDSGCIPISGNVEHWIINGDINRAPARESELYRNVREMMEWIADHIAADHLEWLLGWPDEYIEGGAYFVHDSPYDRRRLRELIATSNSEAYLFHAESLLPNSPESKYVKNAAIVRELGCNKVFCGHTHTPHLRSFDGVTFCNVGGAGFCLDGDPRPSWASWDGDRIEIHRFDYDIERTANLVRTGKVPILDREAYVTMLKTGKHWRNFVTPKAEKD